MKKLVLSAIFLLLWSSNSISGTVREIDFLRALKQGEYNEAYTLIGTINSPEFRDILMYHKLSLELELGLNEKAIESYFSREWMPYAKDRDYAEFFNTFLRQQDSVHKDSLSSFVKACYRGNAQNQALLDYAVYLKDTIDLDEESRILHQIISRKGYSWQKREAMKMLYAIEDISSLSLAEMKKRISLCLDLRLLDMAGDYISRIKSLPGLKEYDYYRYLADLCHRQEDYEASLENYISALKYAPGNREASGVKYQILLRYLYTGSFDQALVYISREYKSLQPEFKAYFLLTKIRILSRQERMKEAADTYKSLIKHYKKYKGICSSAQLSLASYLIFYGDYDNVSAVLGANLSSDNDYRQNKLLLFAIVYKEKGETGKSLEALQNLIGINPSSYYSLFALDFLRSFPRTDIQRIGYLEAFYRCFSGEADYSYIKNSINMNPSESLFLETAYELETAGIRRFLESLRLSAEGNPSVYKALELAISLVENSFYDEAVYILSSISSKDSKTSIMLFLARLYLIAQNQQPYFSLRLAESDKSVKSRNIPAFLLPGYLKRALYPAGYLPYVLKNLVNPKISPFFILAIMREESRFQPAIVSWAGAIGLMQLLEDTAKRFYEGDLRLIVEKENNIRIGMQYINSLFDEFENLDFVAISYNAGEKRKRLIYLESDNPLRYFLLSNITWFSETRHYLRKVWSSYLYYQLIYHRVIQDYLNAGNMFNR